MTSMLHIVLMTLMTAPGVALAQPQPNPIAAPAHLTSPEIAPDHTVTFRLYAPKATTVTLNASWLGATDLPMTKDDSGVWSIIAGPLPNGNAKQIVSQGFGLGPTPSLTQVTAPAPNPTPTGPRGQTAGIPPIPYEDSYPESLVRDVIPFVEKTYRVYPDKRHRAIVGLSMGGTRPFWPPRIIPIPLPT